MSELYISQAGVQRLKKHLEERLRNGMDEVVAYTRSVVRVDTGRMQSTVRRTDVEHQGNRMMSRMIVGGLKVPGIYREIGEMRLVDYAAIVESKYADISRNLPRLYNILRRSLNATRTTVGPEVEGQGF